MRYVRIVNKLNTYAYKGKMFVRKETTGEPKDHPVSDALCEELLALDNSPFREVVDGEVIASPMDRINQRKQIHNRESRTFLSEDVKAAQRGEAVGKGDITLEDLEGNEDQADVDSGFVETAEDAEDLVIEDLGSSGGDDETEEGQDAALSQLDRDGDGKPGGSLPGNETVDEAKGPRATKDNAPPKREGPRRGPAAKKKAEESKGKFTIKSKTDEDPTTEGAVET